MTKPSNLKGTLRTFGSMPQHGGQLRTQAAQPKIANGVVKRNPPVAPPVYRPQPVPRVLQTKSSSFANANARQAPRQMIAPPVYRPEAKKIVQPKATPQRKSPTLLGAKGPQQKRIAQPKMASVTSSRKLPTAPPVYRPNPRPFSAQPKIMQAHAIQRMQNLFGPKAQEDIFDLLGENFAKNEEESKATGVQPLFGDPDLVRIYRTEIQTNPSYKTMEPDVRNAPLTMSWVSDNVFGTSTSRALYDGVKHTIGVAESLKGNTEKIVSFIEFELLNAKSKPVFSAIEQEYGKDLNRHVLDYTGIPMFNPHDRRPINQQLATAKMIVAMEREEYRNVIRLEKALQAVGKQSMFHGHLQGGTHARWSSFANYLQDQCASGHYANLDPKIKEPTWNGWRFVTQDEKIARDPLT